MIRAFNKATLAIFVLFLIITAITWAWEYFYIIPEKHCEQGGGWWAPKWHACGQPLHLDKLPRLNVTEAPDRTPPPAQPATTPAR